MIGNQLIVEGSRLGGLIALAGAWVTMAAGGDPVPFPRVQVGDFGATAAEGGASVSWRAEVQYGVLSYLLERVDPVRGEFVPVTSSPVPAEPFESSQVGYRVLDEGVESGDRLTYRLTALDVAGGSTVCGPFEVTVEPRGEVPGAAAPSPCVELSVPPSSPAPEGSSQGDRVPSSVRLGVIETGMYLVAASNIAACLEQPVSNVLCAIASTNLALTGGGREIAWEPAADGGGIVFFGEAVASHYTDENVYCLATGPGRVMAARAGGAKGEVPDQSFVDLSAFEGNDGDRTQNNDFRAYFTDPHEDFRPWTYVYPPTKASHTFSFQSSGAVIDPSLTGHLAVSLRGAMDDPGTLNQHARVFLNGALIGEGVWAGQVPHIVSGPFPQSVLRLPPAVNEIRIDGILDSGVLTSVFFVFGFTVEYRRRFEAAGDTLGLWAEGYTNIAVRALSTPAVRVYDVTDAASPIRVETDSAVAETNGTWTVCFSNDPATNRRYRVLADSAFRTPALYPDFDSNLKSPTNAAEEIVIFASPFRDGAETLAAHRRAQGLSCAAVDLQDVYDEFRHGLADPWAVKEFVAFAHAHWAAPPRYALMVGNGTHDYEDALDYGNCLLPPLMALTPYGLKEADNSVGDVDDNGVPDLAVGRLPVTTTNQLQGIVAKMRSYEAATEWWKARVMMAADDADPDAGNFPADSDSVAARVSPSYAVTNVHLKTTHTTTQARLSIRDGFNRGCAILNYIGHGYRDAFAAEKILQMSDVPLLTGAANPPLVLGMTCMSGIFAEPQRSSLGKDLVLRAAGGASAVWAPVTLAMNSAGVAMNRAFFDAVFSDHDVRVGDGILKALKAYADADADGNPTCDYPYLLNAYVLLGDPAMAVAAPGFHFSGWRAIMFSEAEQEDPAVSGPAADPDGDGIANLMEFALGRDPKDGLYVPEFEAGRLAVADPRGGVSDHATLTFTRRKWLDKADVFAEVCTDLTVGDWRGGPDAAVVVSAAEVDIDTLRITLLVNEPLTPEAPLFVRLKAVYAE